MKVYGENGGRKGDGIYSPCSSYARGEDGDYLEIRDALDVKRGDLVEGRIKKFS